MADNKTAESARHEFAVLGRCKKCGLDSGAHMASGWFLAFSHDLKRRINICGPDAVTVAEMMRKGNLSGQ